MASILQTTPAVVLGRSAGVSQFGSLNSLPSVRRPVTVRCSVEPKEEAKEATPVGVPPPSPTPAPAMKAKAPSTNFTDLLAFSGPAPERINGRLAMIGFVGALAAEIASGQDLFTQISNGGVPVFLGTSVVLTVASLIPLFQGISVESKSKGLMTSDAELWNGRVAMLGLVALAFTEYVKGGAFV